jgi:hypothetical protein
MNRAARLTVLLSILAASSLAQGVPAGRTTGLRGTVLDAAGWPVAGTEATLKLDDEDGAPEPRTTTNEKGAFEFLSIQDGMYTLTLKHAGFIAGVLRRIEVSENEVTELKPFTLQISGECGGGDLYKAEHVPLSKGNASKGALSAVLKDQQQKPLAATFIYLVLGESSILARARTDARGKFTFKDLGPGDYKLLIDRYGFYTEILPGYEVEAGSESVYPPVTLVKCPKGDCDPRQRQWIICQ